GPREHRPGHCGHHRSCRDRPARRNQAQGRGDGRPPRRDPEMTMNNLDGKVALVTGSGRGIGRALVQKLASHGARVVVNDLDQSATDETVADIRAAGGTAMGCVGNVTDPAFAGRFIGTALTTWGGLDIIVNNAGYTWD